MRRRKVKRSWLLAVSSFREILAVTVEMLDIAAAFLKDRQNALDIVHWPVLTNIRLTNCMYVPQWLKIGQNGHIGHNSHICHIGHNSYISHNVSMAIIVTLVTVVM